MSDWCICVSQFYLTVCHLLILLATILRIPSSADFPHEFYIDRSLEYWTGCTLAYFQWRQNLSFRTILQKIPVQKILGLYPLGHEQNARNIADILSDML